MQPREILKRRKARRTRVLHPSRPYKGFSTALNLGENTWQCSENHSASPKGSACNYRPTGRTWAQLPAPAATFWGLYMEIRWDLLTERPPQEAKTRGSGLVFLPRLGEHRRVRGGAAGSEGLALLERLQRHRCPLPTPTSLTWAQTRYAWNLLEALQARATSHSHWRLL